MIDRNFIPLRRSATTETKADGQLDDPAELLGGDVDYRVALLHVGYRYSTATQAPSSAAIPATRAFATPCVTMSLGGKIREARHAAKMTQQQVADALDITKGAVSQWESNQSTPTLTQFRAFCSVTNASADEILLDKELRGIEKRFAALPDALREYATQALAFAEEVKSKIPVKFMVPPTKATYQAFHDHLVALAGQLRSTNNK